MVMVNPAAPMARARKMAESGGVLVVLAILVSATIATRQHIAVPALDAIDAGQAWPDVINTTLASAVWALPSIYLMLALWELRAAVQDCFFSHEAGSSLRRAGYWALWALFAKMLLVPTIAGIFEPAPVGIVLSFETFDFGLIGFAALLALAGQVLETATSYSEGLAEV